MTTIKDLLLAALRDIGADGVGSGKDTVALEVIERGHYWPLPSDRPAFRDASGELVPLPDWLEHHGGALFRWIGPSSDEVQVWCHCPGRFELWIGRYATSDVDDDIELVRDEYPTAPEAFAAAEAWIKEQGR